jgi:hypothetical protein
MHTLSLTTAELQTIHAALLAISPTGGGSAPYTLVRKTGEALGDFDADALVMRFIQNVLADAEEAGAIEILDRAALAA